MKGAWGNFSLNEYKVKKILSSEKKSKDDIKFLIGEFKTSSYLNQLIKAHGPKAVNYFLKDLILKEYNEPCNLYSLGEPSTKCFFVVKGQVTLLSPVEQDQELNENQKNLLLKRRNSIIDTVLKAKGTKDKIFNKEIFSKGMVFGQTELKFGQLRKGTASITHPVTLGEIKREDFLKITEKTHKLDLIEELKFVQSIPFLQTIPSHTTRKIYKQFIRKTAKINEVIVAQEQPINRVYIVKSGQFNLTYTDLFDLKNGYNLNFYLSTNKNLSNERFTESRLHEIKGHEQMKENYNFLILGTGELFGDIELSQDKEKSLYTITCAEEGSEYFSLKFDIFKQLVSSHFYTFFLDYVKEKMSSYEKRIEEIKHLRSEQFCSRTSMFLNKLVDKVDRVDKVLAEKHLNKNFKSSIQVFDPKKYSTPDFKYGKHDIVNKSLIHLDGIVNNNELKLNLNLGERVNEAKKVKKRGINLSVFLKQFEPKEELNIVMPEIKKKFNSMIFKTNLPERQVQTEYNSTYYNSNNPSVCLSTILGAAADMNASESIYASKEFKAQGHENFFSGRTNVNFASDSILTEPIRTKKTEKNLFESKIKIRLRSASKIPYDAKTVYGSDKIKLLDTEKDTKYILVKHHKNK